MTRPTVRGVTGTIRRVAVTTTPGAAADDGGVVCLGCAWSSECVRLCCLTSAHTQRTYSHRVRWQPQLITSNYITDDGKRPINGHNILITCRLLRKRLAHETWHTQSTWWYQKYTGFSSNNEHVFICQKQQTILARRQIYTKRDEHKLPLISTANTVIKTGVNSINSIPLLGREIRTWTSV